MAPKRPSGTAAAPAGCVAKPTEDEAVHVVEALPCGPGG